ncbi:universal stress protein [Halomarina salina]|uniref:Universal stress protein n=1 Tax=Halomarina salina TaxID=1872699 RepID=A0ABD5RM91_9EURY|nr:universal stress protein [Halomarina salina]
MYDTILVPIDGSDGGNRAAEHALELADRYDATIHAMYVVDVSRYGEPALSSVELVVDELEDRGRDLLTTFADRADNDGIVVETKHCHGAPHEEIVAYAEDADADLVVMGFQGYSHQNRIGSVAERVTRTGVRPVMLV